MSTATDSSVNGGRTDDGVRSVDVLLDGIRALEERLAAFRKQFAAVKI